MRYSRQPRPRTRLGALGGRSLVLLRNWQGQPVGAVINPPAAAAQVLMESGVAKPVEDEPVVEAASEAVEEAETPVKKKRGRPRKTPE